MPKTITATHKETGETAKFIWDGKGNPKKEDIDKVFADKRKKDEGMGHVNAPDSSYLQRMGTGASQALLGSSGGGPLESITQPLRHPLDTLKSVLRDPKQLYSPESIGGSLALLPFGAAMHLPAIEDKPSLKVAPLASLKPPEPISSFGTRAPTPIPPIQELNAPVRPPTGLSPQRSTRLNKVGELETLKVAPVNKMIPEQGNRIDPQTVNSYKANPPSLENSPVLRSDNTVFDGHHRITAAAQSGKESIPVWSPSPLAQDFAKNNYKTAVDALVQGKKLHEMPELLEHAKSYPPSHLENDLRGQGMSPEDTLSVLQQVHGPDLVSKELEFADRGQSDLVKGKTSPDDPPQQ